MQIKKILILFFLFCLIGEGIITPRQIIIKKDLPKDLLPEVRENILKLYDSDPIVRANGAGALGAMGEKALHAVPYLIELLKDNHALEWRTENKSSNPMARGDFVSGSSPGNEAARALGEIGDLKAVLPLIEALNNKGYRHAALSLGKLKDKRAVVPLISRLKSNDWAMRGTAALSLGRIGDKRGTIPIINALKRKDWKGSAEIWWAVEALGEINDPRAVDILISIVNEHNEAFGWYAVVALGKYNTTRAISTLVNELNNTRNDDEAHTALKKHKNTIMIEPLIQMLKDGNLYGRENAAKLLGFMRAPRAIQQLEWAALNDKDSNVSETSTEALTEIGKPALKSLIKILGIKPSATNRRIREIAVSGLGDIGDVAAIKPLIEALGEDEVHQSIPMDAARALKKIGTPAVEYLIIALKDKRISVKRNAAEILGEIKDPRAIKPLIKSVNDKSIDTTVAMALGNITGKSWTTNWKLWWFWQKKRNRVITFIFIGILVVFIIRGIVKRKISD